MTDFLVKCFVKDHDKTEEPQVRPSYGILDSIVGICCNLLLFASKLRYMRIQKDRARERYHIG